MVKRPDGNSYSLFSLSFSLLGLGCTLGTGITGRPTPSLRSCYGVHSPWPTVLAPPVPSAPGPRTWSSSTCENLKPAAVGRAWRPFHRSAAVVHPYPTIAGYFPANRNSCLFTLVCFRWYGDGRPTNWPPTGTWQAGALLTPW
ncbi:hypothetical protein QBC45DRAFT_431347 [Copromyces sp. CBS 386.78]|nr:hypothetical protein QBC45DRAFT_431347 [Copromyces sp. CBS 386.78]